MAFELDLGDIGLFDVPKITVEGFEDVEDAAEEFELTEEEEPTETRIYTRPIVRKPQTVLYENAEQFARDLVLDNEHETFAFVSGNFVFGDFMEALVAMRRLRVRRMAIMTLSMNDENIDSLRNIIEWEPVERLDLVLSDYWYAHERKVGGLVGYLFEQLDIDGLALHVGFAGVHCKTWAVETPGGNTLTMHGSANLRSSRNIEQLHITPDRDVFEFVDEFTQRTLEAYDVVNQDARKRRIVRRGRLWQAVAGSQDEPASGARQAAPTE